MNLQEYLQQKQAIMLNRVDDSHVEIEYSDKYGHKRHEVLFIPGDVNQTKVVNAPEPMPEEDFQRPRKRTRKGDTDAE